MHSPPACPFLLPLRGCARAQAQFAYDVLRREQDEYEREGVAWQRVGFEDNQSCIDLLRPLPLLHPAGHPPPAARRTRPVSILELLDEQAKTNSICRQQP